MCENCAKEIGAVLSNKNPNVSAGRLDQPNSSRLPEVDSLNSEQYRMYHVDIPGHHYEVHNVEKIPGDETQHIRFVQKVRPDDMSGRLVTLKNGTTNEALLQVLIDRIEFLDGYLSDRHNKNVLHHLKEALWNLDQRTAERMRRGVEGTHKR